MPAVARPEFRSTAEPAAAHTEPFDDLLQANRSHAEHFTLGGFDGVAHAGVAMVTCMDSRIDPLGIIGLQPGDAKVLRNPGGRVTEPVLVGLVLAVHLLGVNRILVVQHTRCAMASPEPELRARLQRSAGPDAGAVPLLVIEDQESCLRTDVAAVQEHSLIRDRAQVGGFLYDVDSGRLQPVA